MNPFVLRLPDPEPEPAKAKLVEDVVENIVEEVEREEGGKIEEVLAKDVDAEYAKALLEASTRERIAALEAELDAMRTSLAGAQTADAPGMPPRGSNVAVVESYRRGVYRGRGGEGGRARVPMNFVFSGDSADRGAVLAKLAFGGHSRFGHLEPARAVPDEGFDGELSREDFRTLERWFGSEGPEAFAGTAAVQTNQGSGAINFVPSLDDTVLHRAVRVEDSDAEALNTTRAEGLRERVLAVAAAHGL